MKFLSIHHTGGYKGNSYASTKHLTVEDINTAHAARWWDFPSQIKFSNGRNIYIGYNFVILPNGHHFQARPCGAETAAQRGFNFNTISICLIGNFTRGVDTPTLEQIKKLQFLMELFVMNNYASYITNGLSILPNTKIDITPARIHPHRFFSPTSCYGNLPNNWARKLISEHLYKYDPMKRMLIDIQARILEIRAQLRNMGKLKGLDEGCTGERG